MPTVCNNLFPLVNSNLFLAAAPLKSAFSQSPLTETLAVSYPVMLPPKAWSNLYLL